MKEWFWIDNGVIFKNNENEWSIRKYYNFNIWFEFE